MRGNIFIRLIYISLFSIILNAGFAQQQVDIFQFMDRTDLRLQEIETIANNYFNQVGTGRGSGFKQYQRWLYERKFRTDENGYFIRPETEDKAYYDFTRSSANRGMNTWFELGPRQWTYTSGWNPGVGRITSVAIHPSDTTVIYVSSPGGGIWKSTNSGATWSPLIDFVNSSWMNVFNLCIDPLNPSVIYAALSSGGVLKSVNGGASWSTTGSGPITTRKVVIHPANSNIVFATASNGIWRSVNAGTNWTQVQNETKEDIEFNPLNPNIMYASGSSGTSCVWRSADNGVTWTAIGSGSGITNSGRTLLGVSPADPNIVYAVQANGSVFGRIYKSSDAGLTYITTVVGDPTLGTNYFGYETNGTGTTGQATYDMAICVNPLNANEVHIAGIICWKSTNGGSSFVATTAWSYPNSIGYNHADVHALEWVKKTIYSGSDGGVYKSTNGANDWTDLSLGLGIRQFYRIACAKTDPNVITTGAQDNGSSFRRTNGSWVDWLGADGMDNIISPTNAAIAIGTSQYGGIYKTTNSGSSRTNLSQPADGNWVTPIVMHPTSHDTIFGGWTGVWRSVNGGSAWTNLSPSITVKMNTLAVAPSNTKYIYASSGSTLYRTADGGATWTTITAPSTINSVFVSKNNPAKIWIACNSSSNRVFVSTDAGTTFTNISTGLPSLVARSIVVDEDAVETIYVGMNIGVYYRDNITNTWTEHASSLPLVAVNEVEIQKSGGKLRVATYGRGVWESNLQNIQVVCNPVSGLTTTSISQNSAALNWSAVSGATSYRVEYKATSSSTWLLLDSLRTSTTFNLSGLNSSTSYDWRVRSNCSGALSAFVQSTFATISSCPAPSGLSAVVTSGSASLSWNAVSGALSYRTEYKPSSSSTWMVIDSIVTSYSVQLTGLNPSTSYDWRVRAACSLETGVFGQSSFTTDVACGNTSGLTSSVSGNNVNLSWNAVAGAINYVLDYKLSSSTTWISTPGTSTNSIVLSSLGSGSYNWRVRAICVAGTGNFSSADFAVYCVSKGSSTTAGYVDYVALGSIIRTSLSDGGYYDGTNLLTAVKPGIRYTITISPGYSGSSKTTYWRIFVDYNRDGDFADLGEQVSEKSFRGTSNSSVNFTIPLTASLGPARIRVVMSTTAFQSGCTTYSSGETEDFTLNITNTPETNPEENISVETNPSNIFELYPNPANDYINVKFSLQGEEETAEVKIYDITGRVVFGSRITGQKGQNEEQLDLSTLGSGKYFVELRTIAFSRTRSIVISR